jgi:hypothetical protein
VLRRYKGQEAVERRYEAVKGPLAVAPMFLRNNRRITALITVICLALLIFCLIERQARRAIAPDTHLDGLAAGHRPARPTRRLILAALAPLRLSPPAMAGQRPSPAQPAPARAVRPMLVCPAVVAGAPRGPGELADPQPDVGASWCRESFQLGPIGLGQVLVGNPSGFPGYLHPFA